MSRHLTQTLRAIKRKGSPASTTTCLQCHERQLRRLSCNMLAPRISPRHDIECQSDGPSPRPRSPYKRGYCPFSCLLAQRLSPAQRVIAKLLARIASGFSPAVTAVKLSKINLTSPRMTPSRCTASTTFHVFVNSAFTTTYSATKLVYHAE